MIIIPDTGKNTFRRAKISLETPSSLLEQSYRSIKLNENMESTSHLDLLLKDQGI